MVESTGLNMGKSEKEESRMNLRFLIWAFKMVAT